MLWRLKEGLRNLTPWIIIGVIAWGGYSMYRKGAFRHGIPSLGQTLSYLPHFGSRFSQYNSRRSNYAYAPAKHGRKHKAHRRSSRPRRHGRRR